MRTHHCFLQLPHDRIEAVIFLGAALAHHKVQPRVLKHPRHPAGSCCLGIEWPAPARSVRGARSRSATILALAQMACRAPGRDDKKRCRGHCLTKLCRVRRNRSRPCGSEWGALRIHVAAHSSRCSETSNGKVMNPVGGMLNNPDCTGKRGNRCSCDCEGSVVMDCAVRQKRSLPCVWKQRSRLF